MITAELKEQIKKLPPKPGIYLFKNSKNKPIYIGKALNLKNRLKSYLKTSDPRLGQMILETRKINFIKTESDIEALILESQYIKKYRPDFNIMLRDDKQYFFVGFSNKSFSKIFLTHQPRKIRNSNIEILNKFNPPAGGQNSKLETSSDFEFRASDFHYIGPFTDGNALKATLRLLRRIFPYCTCKQTHHNYCLNYHIGRCIGECCLKIKSQKAKGKITIKNSKLKEYQKNINAIKDILSGKKSSLIKKLEKEMKTLSSQRKYEKAIELQYKIEKLKKILANAKINRAGSKVMIYHNSSPILKSLQKFLYLPSLPQRIEAYDIANIQGKYAVGSMVVFNNGQPDKQQYRKFKIQNRPTSQVGTLGDVGMLREVLARRLNHPEWPYPDLILIDGGKAQFNTALSVLSNFHLQLSTFVIALIKNEKHMGHKILTEKNKEISLSKLPAPLKNFLLQINSEAHRFAISYYRKLHAKSIK